MLKIIEIILLLIVPYSVLRRLKFNCRGAIINPILYLLMFSYLYLLIPNFYISYVIYDVYNLDISASAFQLSEIVCLWHVIIFYIYYLFSKDSIVLPNDNRPYMGVYQISLVVYILLSTFYLFILVKDVPGVFALRGNREEALQRFYQTIQARYKLAILNYIFFGVTTVVLWKTRNLLWLLPLLTICVMDFSHGGRTMTFMVFIYSYINIVLIKNKLFFKFALGSILFMMAVGVLQRAGDSTWWWSLYTAGAEFSNTRVTTSYVLDVPRIHGDLFQHAIISVLKIFPGGISNKLYGIPDGMWYGEELSQHLDLGFGLAGNIATEAIFYGGIYFGFISPLIIGLIYFLLNRLRVFKTLVGFIFVLLLCAKTQDIMRMYFYENFFYLIQMMIFFLPFITFFEFKKRIFNTSIIK